MNIKQETEYIIHTDRHKHVLVEDLSMIPNFTKFYAAEAPYDVEAALSTSLFGNDDTIIKGSTREGGFGLFNIKERIDLIGRKVVINSELGDVTEVTLMAPLKNQEQAQIGAKTEGEEDNNPKASTTGKKIKVLLVDDHKMMREGLRKIVDDEDDLIVVAEAADGKEAIQMAEEASPDIIVMDVNMPVMDGITATQEITSKRSGQRIIGLSLHDHEKVIESMRSAGASAYLSKNEAFETLCATIRSEANLSGE